VAIFVHHMDNSFGIFGACVWVVLLREAVIHMEAVHLDLEGTAVGGWRKLRSVVQIVSMADASPQVSRITTMFLNPMTGVHLSLAQSISAYIRNLYQCKWDQQI